MIAALNDYSCTSDPFEQTMDKNILHESGWCSVNSDCVLCSRRHIREQLEWRKAGFSSLHVERSWVQQFGESSICSSRLGYVVWRFFLAVVMMIGFGLELSSDIHDGVGPWYPIYLTNWSLFLDNLYLNASFAIALSIYLKSPDPGSAQPWSTKTIWGVRSVAQQGALVVTISYWALEYDGILTLKTIWVHLFNSIVVVLDILTSCYEVRLLHYTYALASGTLYVVWSVIHYVLCIGTGPPPTQRYIYSYLDWASAGKVLHARQFPARERGCTAHFKLSHHSHPSHHIQIQKDRQRIGDSDTASPALAPKREPAAQRRAAPPPLAKPDAAREPRRRPRPPRWSSSSSCRSATWRSTPSPACPASAASRCCGRVPRHNHNETDASD